MLGRAVAASKAVGARALSTSRAVAAAEHGGAAAAAAAAAAASGLGLNFAAPPRSLGGQKGGERVNPPGRDGACGVGKNSPPVVSGLRPGVRRVGFADNSVEEFFVPGGFSFKHANNVIDVSTPEGIKLDTVDVDALRASNTEATKKRDGTAPGSKEHAEAKVVLEVYRALSQALKVTV